MSAVRSQARSQVGDLLLPHWDAFSRTWDREILLLEGLRGFAESHLEVPLPEMVERYPRFAAALHRQAEGVVILSIAPAGTVASVYPIRENEISIGHNLLEDRRPQTGEAVARTLASGKIALAGPYPQARGDELTFEAYCAVHGREVFWGMVASTIDVIALVKSSGFEELSPRLTLAFRSLDGTVFWGDPAVFHNDPVVRRLESFGQIIEVGAHPLGGWQAFVLPRLSAAGAFGFLVILMASGAAYLFAGGHPGLSAFGSRTSGPAAPRERTQESEERAEEAFRADGERLRLALLGTGDGLWDWDLKTDHVYLSPRWKSMLGFAEGELEDHLDTWKRLLHPEDRERTLAEVNVLAAQRRNEFDTEFRMRHKNGEYRSILSRGLLIRGPGGEAVRLVGTHTDMTGRRRREAVLSDRRAKLQDNADRRREKEEKEKLESRLEQAQKMESIGRLAGGVAHDFNNMLSVILGCTELIKARTIPDGPLSGYLQEIEKAADRSRDITRQLLAFSRKQAIAPKHLKLNQHIDDTRKILARMIGEDIHLHFHPGKEVWTIKLDPFQLDQILMNLAVNARDAMPGGGRLVMKTANVAIGAEHLEEHRLLLPGEYVLLEVTDEGAGMDDETLSRMFEPFFTTKDNGQGTGLGLSTVYGIVKQNNGFVNVYSEPGIGTSFRIYFPRTPGEEALPAPEEAPVLEGSGTVLLVEDSQLVRELVAGILSQIGFTVLVAETPGEALSLCEEQDIPIDILVTDVVMPNMNGAELGEKISALRPGIKTLFMSGYPEDFIAHRGLLKKGVHFIQKPFGMKEIAGKINQIIEDKPLGA